MTIKISYACELASILESWKHLHPFDDNIVKNVAIHLRDLEECHRLELLHAKELEAERDRLEAENLFLRTTLNKIVDIADTVFGDVTNAR